MKRVFSLYGMIVFCLVLGKAQASHASPFLSSRYVDWKNDTAPFYSKHYLELKKIFESEPVSKGHIIFFGNSITERGNWRVLLKDSTVINRGISGDVTYGLLNRIDDVIRREPSKLFILIGINDLAHKFSIDTICAHYALILQKIKEGTPRTKVYVESILPTNPSMRKRLKPLDLKLNEEVLAVNKRLQQIARAYHCTWINIHDRFVDGNGNLMSQYTDDGIHPNAAGYDRWVRFLQSKQYL